MEQESGLHFEENYSKRICIQCLRDRTDFNLDVLLKSFCDSCYTLLFNNGLESFLSKMSSCVMCVNGIYNHVNPFEHICTRTDVYICDSCHNVYKSKHQIEHHLAHSEYKFEKLCAQKGGHNCYSGKLNIESTERKLRIKEVKYLSKDCHLVETSGENITSRKQSCVNNCSRMDIQKENEINQKKGKNKHIYKHSKETFTKLIGFKRHEHIHTGKMPYICKFCKKKFSFKSYLIRHEEIHTGEKPHICKYCKKAFTTTNDLKTHEWIHAGEKSYICKYCKKAFTTTNDLKTHEWIHAGEKPYICKYCKKAFTTTSGLKSHERIHW